LLPVMSVGCLDFSEKTAFAGPQPRFSPDKKHVALAQDFRLVIRNVESLAVVGLFSCLDRIEAFDWSPGGDHILCSLYKRGTLQVFSVTDPEWSCCITEGLAGIVSARWCPNGEQIILTSEFQVKLSLWSLVDQSCHQLPPPKHPEAGLAFSPDGAMLAAIQRWECKDSLQIYDVESWQSISHISIPTVDAADLAWSPDSSCVAVWDDLAQGPSLAIFSTEGECLATHKGSGGAHSHGLGFKCVSWSPSGQLLGVGTSDQDLGVLNSVTWTSLTTFGHPAVVSGPASAVIYQEDHPEEIKVLAENNKDSQALSSDRKATVSEEDARTRTKRTGARPPKPLLIPKPPSKPPSLSTSPKKPQSARERNSGAPPSSAATVTAAASKLSRQLELATEAERTEGDMDGGAPDMACNFAVGQLPLRMPLTRPATDRPNPKLGIGIAAWGLDGSLLASRCDARPNSVWIWDTALLELSTVITFTAPVKSLEWDPSGRNRLVAACGSGRFYMWTPEGVSAVPVPGVKVLNLKWAADGSALMVVGKDVFCFVYMS